MKAYLDILDDILCNGKEKTDRTGVGTISLSSPSIEVDLSKGFPLLTTKEVNFNAIRTELLWFLEKRDISENPTILRRLDVRRYKEIGYGPIPENWPKKTIWDGNTSADYWMHKAKFEYDAGTMYGTQWRYWQKPVFDKASGLYRMEYIDQVDYVLNLLDRDQTSRRIYIDGTNPAERDDMSLESCIVFILFTCSNDDVLDCTVQARSTDVFLGLPFDVASFAMLTHLFAHVMNKQVGKLKFNMSDAHIYKNHIPQVKKQMLRTPYDLPQLELDKRLAREHFNGLIPPEFIKIKNYIHHEKITAQMAV